MNVNEDHIVVIKVYKEILFKIIIKFDIFLLKYWWTSNVFLGGSKPILNEAIKQN